MKKILIFILILICAFSTIKAQYTTLNAHSHNDYANQVPFWMAYENHFGSIEADIFAVNGELFVAHNTSDITPDRTLDALYIEPIVKLFTANKNKAWSNNSSTFQLLIDLKTAVEPTLSILVEKLRKYPEVFDPLINNNAVRIVITGNRPQPELFDKYPEFIFFDGLLNMKYTNEQLKRVPLYSENIRLFSAWNGEGNIVDKERVRLKQVIDSVHSVNKKIRFWNCPDNENAWKTYINMGIDYLNTDHIKELADYLNLLSK